MLHWLARIGRIRLTSIVGIATTTIPVNATHVCATENNAIHELKIAPQEPAPRNKIMSGDWRGVSP